MCVFVANVLSALDAYILCFSVHLGSTHFASASFCLPLPRIKKGSGILPTPLSLARHECQTYTATASHTYSADVGSEGQVGGAPALSS